MSQHSATDIPFTNCNWNVSSVVLKMKSEHAFQFRSLENPSGTHSNLESTFPMILNDFIQKQVWVFVSSFALLTTQTHLAAFFCRQFCAAIHGFFKSYIYYKVLVQNSRTQMNTILLMAHTDNTNTWLPDHHETTKNILAYITEKSLLHAYAQKQNVFTMCSVMLTSSSVSINCSRIYLGAISTRACRVKRSFSVTHK